MPAQLPPWLDVTPQSFASAAEAGQRFGIQRDEMAQQAMMEQARLQQSHQQFQTETMMKQQQLMIGKQESDRQFQIQSEQHAMETALRKQQLDLATQTAAQKFQSMQGYQNDRQQAIYAGDSEEVATSKAMMKWGPMMGQSTYGMGSELRALRQVAPPQALDFGEAGKGVMYGGRFYPGPKERGAASEKEGSMTQQDTAKLKVLMARERQLMSSGMGEDDPKIAASLKKVRDEIDQITSGGVDGSAGAGGGADVPATSRFKITAIQ